MGHVQKSSKDILQTVQNLFKRNVSHDTSFRAHFGVPISVCAQTWNLIGSSGLLPSGAQPKHLLWALNFLKVYTTEEVHSTICGASRPTFRKWIWKFVKLISSLKIVRKSIHFILIFNMSHYNFKKWLSNKIVVWFKKIFWQNRTNSRRYRNLHITVDGTDCKIYEPSPFCTGWYSHKFHGPGLRYEVGLSISEGFLVWVNGPFACGYNPDQKIFNTNLKSKLSQNELVLADFGYGGDRIVHDINGDRDIASTLLARHETVNRRLKSFSVLGSVFRHDLSLHCYCFHASANLVQLTLQSSNPLFQV